jgi:hypothetical protein
VRCDGFGSTIQETRLRPVLRLGSGWTCESRPNGMAQPLQKGRVTLSPIRHKPSRGIESMYDLFRITFRCA